MKSYIAVCQGIPKIGLTGQKYLSARLASLQNGNPFKVDMFRVWQCDDKKAVILIDQIVKRKLRRRLIRSEYYDVRPDYMAKLIQDTAREIGADLKQSALYGQNPWKNHEREKEVKKHDRAA